MTDSPPRNEADTPGGTNAELDAAAAIDESASLVSQPATAAPAPATTAHSGLAATRGTICLWSVFSVGIVAILVGMLSTYGRGLLSAFRPGSMGAAANATMALSSSIQPNADGVMTASTLPAHTFDESPLATASVVSSPPPTAPITAWTPSKSFPKTFSVVGVWPHDSDAFTQGLQWFGSTLYEGTGLNSRSVLRTVDLSRARGYTVAKEARLDGQYFGEGIAVWIDSDGAHGVPGRPVVLQLTWQNRAMFLYDANTLEVLRRDIPFTTLRNEGACARALFVVSFSTTLKNGGACVRACPVCRVVFDHVEERQCVRACTVCSVVFNHVEERRCVHAFVVSLFTTF